MKDNPGGLNSIRDTVESIWVAIVLAFVLRAFVAEAFVIPTGSMAPELMGEHWRLTCPACGYRYDYGSPHSGRLSHSQRETPTGAECPNCGYLYQYSKMPEYINNGDRVLVLKYSYAFRRFLGMRGPRPWDVIVFKNPQNNRENYIKRLVGLPGETIEIVHGDVYYSSGPNEPFRIRRKPPRVQEVMWRVVYDNDYLPKPKLVNPHSRPGWTAVDDAWEIAGGGRDFVFAGGESPARMAFHAERENYLPGTGYNSSNGHDSSVRPEIDVCSDVKLSVVLFPGKSPSRIKLNMSVLEHEFQARIFTAGSVGIYHRSPDSPAEIWEKLAEKQIPALKNGRGYRIDFANADLAIGLHINGRRELYVDGDYPMDYQSVKKRLMRASARPLPAPRLSIAAAGGACRLQHVGVFRDVYYTCPDNLAEVPKGPLGQYARRIGVSSGISAWGTTGNPIRLEKHPESPDLDEFFVLGDNSTRSLDGRAWTSAAPSLRLWRKNGKILHGRLEDDEIEDAEPLYRLGTVPRYNMIGKAMFVYWPAGYRLPGLPSLSLIPNAGRMRLIR